MSIAQAQKQREMDQRLTELSDSLASLALLVKELTERVEAIENKPRPGRPPKDSP